MNEQVQLNHPWLVAVWPGMGHVALNAGLYLRTKLGMNSGAELESGNIFDVEAVEVRDGIIQPARLPRTQIFVWTDPNKKHDIVLVIERDSRHWSPRVLSPTDYVRERPESSNESLLSPRWAARYTQVRNPACSEWPRPGQP